MNSETHTIETAAAPPTRRRRRLVGLVLVAALGVGACESQPSARRIAKDLINALAESEAEQQCMLDKLETYSDDQLDEITASASQPGPGTAIDQFEADLAACD